MVVTASRYLIGVGPYSRIGPPRPPTTLRLPHHNTTTILLSAIRKDEYILHTYLQLHTYLHLEISSIMAENKPVVICVL